MKPVVIIACLFLLCQSCSKPVKDPLHIQPGLTEMVRTQTQCADVWGYGESNDATIAKLSSYLLQKNITPTKITWEKTGEEAVCLACTCSKGFTIHVWVEDHYINSLSKEGFTKK